VIDTHRTYVDDRSAHTEKLSGQIYRNYHVPLLKRHPLKWRITLQSGIVDKDVGRPQHHRAEHVQDLSFVGHVREMRVSLDTVLLDGAGLTKGNGDGAADTRIWSGRQ
jgi:hypothetical protein